MSFYIGLMSGTSMDGIDAALIEADSNKLIYGITRNYTDDTRKRLDNLLKGADLNFAALCQLNTLIGRDFAEAAHELLRAAKVSAQDIEAIGSHGQTVCHNTLTDIPYTLQLGCAHTIAELTGITVVADFRTRDLVNGGQGAPFAPLYHHELLRQKNVPVAVVNIGGIANITFIKPGAPVKGWDVGPGNCLMDAWISRHQGKPYDKSGAWARQGNISEPLLKQFLADEFIQAKAPKSIGKEHFSLAWLDRYVTKNDKPEDVQKTLVALTARAIADAMQQEKDPVATLYLCGGGTHNSVLHQMIAEFLPGISVQSIEEAGVSPDYLEAMMFAWLAAQTMMHKAVDLQTITGSRKPAILGAIYPGAHR